MRERGKVKGKGDTRKGKRTMQKEKRERMSKGRQRKERERKKGANVLRWRARARTEYNDESVERVTPMVERQSENKRQ